MLCEDVERCSAAIRWHDVATDRGQDREAPPPEKARLGRGHLIVLLGLILVVGVAGGLIGGTLKTHTVKDFWSWLDMVRGPLALFAVAAVCIALAVAVVILVYARLLWRWGNKAMEKAGTFAEIIEGYKHTDRALRSIIRRFKFGRIAGLDHEDVLDPLSAAEEILRTEGNPTERTSG